MITPNDYLAWLDKEIENNQKAIDSSKNSKDLAYFNGWLKSASLIRAKFLTVTFTTNSESTDNQSSDFTDGLDQ